MCSFNFTSQLSLIAIISSCCTAICLDFISQLTWIFLWSAGVKDVLARCDICKTFSCHQTFCWTHMLYVCIVLGVDCPKAIDINIGVKCDA